MEKITHIAIKAKTCDEIGSIRSEFVKKYTSGKFLGSGSFGEVWGDRYVKGRVWKFGFHLGDAYIDYLEKIVLKNQDNPTFPKIFKYIKAVNPAGKGFYAVNMELLEEGDSREKKWIRNDAADIIASAASIAVNDQLKSFKNVTIKSLKSATKKTSPLLHEAPDVDKLVAANVTPQLADSFSEIAALIQNERANGKKMSSDIRNCNVMWRGNQIVITDPVYTSERNW